MRSQPRASRKFSNRTYSAAGDNQRLLVYHEHNRRSFGSIRAHGCFRHSSASLMLPSREAALRTPQRRPAASRLPASGTTIGTTSSKAEPRVCEPVHARCDLANPAEKAVSKAFP